MQHDVPLIVIAPVVVVMDPFPMATPPELSVLFAPIPMIVTLPDPLAAIIEVANTCTPIRPIPVPFAIPLIVRLPVFVVTVAVIAMPVLLLPQFFEVPVINTSPAPVEETIVDEFKSTPNESLPVPQEVPFKLSNPEFVVIELPVTNIPQAEVVPFCAVPVIVTLPMPIAEMFDAARETPLEIVPVPHEIPLKVIDPELVVIEAPLVMTPRA